MSSHESVKLEEESKQRPAQKQELPGSEAQMDPPPIYITDEYQGSNKLKGKVAIITGGDSGIGRATAIHFAREGADIAILYYKEHDDAETTRKLVQKEGRSCEIYAGDVGDHQFCHDIVNTVKDKFGHIDILVNNAAQQVVQDNLEDITPEQLEKTFRTNIFGYFFMAQAVLPHFRKDCCIVNMTSVTAFKGKPNLLDYSSTKGAITTFTRSLAANLVERGIRVNEVAPGPIWTPLIPASFDEEQVKKFGQETPMKRAGQPCEVATCCVFLASRDSSYITGSTLHPNGGSMTAGGPA